MGKIERFMVAVELKTPDSTLPVSPPIHDRFSFRVLGGPVGSRR
ncbi:MAG: hypothetical protein QXF24_09200 [Thermoproteota archaeon]